MHIRTIDHCVFTNFFSKKPNIPYHLISTQAHVSVGNVNFGTFYKQTKWMIRFKKLF